MLAGLSDIYIGETIADTEEVEALPAIAVDEPTQGVAHTTAHGILAQRCLVVHHSDHVLLIPIRHGRRTGFEPLLDHRPCSSQLVRHTRVYSILGDGSLRPYTYGASKVQTILLAF